MGVELGRERSLFIHLTLVPFIKSSGELKTKPTQHSVKELRSIGIQPDILMCRSDREIPAEERRKIALFTNVEPKAVINVPDADTIYRIPLLLRAQGVDDIVARKLQLEGLPAAQLADWERVVRAIETASGAVDIAMVGKYVDLTDAYKSLNEALLHAGIHAHTRVNIHYIDSERVERDGTACLEHMDAILVPGGFGERGIEGKIAAVRFAREHRLPYLGICLGMQVAVIEFARHVAGLEGAHSTEFRKDTPHPVIALITEWIDEDGSVQQRREGGDLGGSMRLGAQPCRLTADSLAGATYGKDVIVERHRHRYEFNNRYRGPLGAVGMRFCGHSLDGRLVEMIELPDHPWFLACQFHPEFTSTPRAGHPLFRGFIGAAIRQRQQRHAGGES
jgi:CTP synthase